MALTSRAPRGKRTPGKRAVKKRAPASKAVGGKKPARRNASPDSPASVEAALAAFAHEVRTPLTGILAVSDLLATSDLGERERRWVDTIKAGAEHLAGLATLFVDAARSRAKGGGLEARQDFFDLRAVARSVGDSLTGRAAAKGLQSRVRISDRLPAFVTGDPVRLRAALENLVDNAVKFTSEGDVGLKVTVARAAKGKIVATFAVSDSGIGLSMAEIKRLFRPFSQANVGIAARFGGAGLGLSSVKQLARAMGGDIVVASRRGGGAVFTLTVMLKPAEAPVAASNGLDDISEAAGGLRILSVEDNPFGRVVLNAILTELGHHAEFVGRGEAAAERVAQGGFDAVLMDMVLPGIDGIEAIRRIRALRSDQRGIPIIGISGKDTDKALARKAGADAFLLKPVSPRALATALLAVRHRAAAAP
ncbi:MAG: response regulator [Rhizobiales bacterium]|nr:response regulator [Hyphomicrobiales bacterium]